MNAATEERIFSALAFMGVRPGQATAVEWGAAAAIAQLDVSHELAEHLDSIDTRLFELVEPEPQRENPVRLGAERGSRTTGERELQVNDATDDGSEQGGGS